MILLSLLLATQAASEPVNEIEVLAQKLREAELDLRFSRADGVLRVKKCELVGSSGDADADALGCRAAADCEAQDFIKKRDFRLCVKDRALELLDELVDSRTVAENAQ